MQLARYDDFRDELQDPGVYEIGYVVRGIFYPKYIGKAPNGLITRIKTYGKHLGRKSHNAVIRSLTPAQFYQLHFHVMRVSRPDGAAIREALMLIRHRYGEDTPYEWNARYEVSILLNAGYDVWDVQERT